MSGIGPTQPVAAGFQGIADIRAGLQALGGARLLAVSPRGDREPAVGRFKLRPLGSHTDGIGKHNATFVVQNAPEGGLRVIDSWKGQVPVGIDDPAHLVTRGLQAAAARFGDSPDALFAALFEHGVAVDFRGRHKREWREFLLLESLRPRLQELMPRMRETIAEQGLKFEVREGQMMGLSFTEIVVRSQDIEYGAARSNLRDASGKVAIGPSRQMSNLGTNQRGVDLVMETVLAPLHYLVMLSGGDINLDSGLLAELKAQGLLTDPR